MGLPGLVPATLAWGLVATAAPGVGLAAGPAPAKRVVATPTPPSVAVTAPVLPPPVNGRCVDEQTTEPEPAAGEAVSPAAAAPENPRLVLSGLVREALERSQALGAARLLAEATRDDVAETRAAKDIQASLSGGLGPDGTRAGGLTQQHALQARAQLSVSQTLYDGGRINALADWRSQLAESARLGVLSQQEQLAAATVSLALERSRYRQQMSIYGQYARKMGCLVQALETIVASDRGRASELVQARKSLQQAELSQVQAQASVRQVETRLRRLVGDGLPGTQGLSTVLLATPPMEQLLDELPRSPDIAQLGSQVNAAEKLARATALGGRPQISWQLSSGATAATAPTGGQGLPQGPQKTANYSLGLSISIPLLNPAVAPASEAARKRAVATAMQREEALDTRRNRLTELYDQTAATFDRARRLSAVLRDSEQVRNYTLQQWQQLGRRSLFDVMGAEGEHYNLRVSYINALHDGQQLNANLLSLGLGVAEWLK